MENLAPIVLFVYNRPEHTKKTLDYLSNNRLANESNLYIFSDGPKDEKQVGNVNKTREIINNIKGFKSVKVYNSPENKGLAESVIYGVTEVTNHYGKAIVLEDDLRTAPGFLEYMNRALSYYKEDKRIWSISGFTPIDIEDSNFKGDVYFTGRASSWGWATWQDRWNSINWNIEDYGEIFDSSVMQKKFNRSGNDLFPMLKDQKNNHINSWAIRWCYNQFSNSAFTVYPSSSLVINIGLSGESTHGALFSTSTILTKKENFDFISLYTDEKIEKIFKGHYDLKLYNYIGMILKKFGLYKAVKKQIKNTFKR